MQNAGERRLRSAKSHESLKWSGTRRIEPYVNLALTSGSKYLVSRDKDMLDLMNDSTFRHASRL